MSPILWMDSASHDLRSLILLDLWLFNFGYTMFTVIVYDLINVTLRFDLNPNKGPWPKPFHINMSCVLLFVIILYIMQFGVG